MDAWVDGSNKQDTLFSYGCVFVEDGVAVHEHMKAYDTPTHTKYRNVAGETYGVLYALSHALKTKATTLNVYHDYNGLQKWADGEWKAGNELSQLYVSLVNEARNHMSITFHKVKAHSGVEFNERADKLAKLAIEEWLSD